MPKYILHVGPPKTGSTSLQSQLFHSRKYLIKRGVLYPEFWLNYVTHHPLTNILRDDKDLRDGNDLREGFNRLNSGEYQTVVFSSETFDELKLPALERLKQYIGDQPVEIIFYVRRWSDRIPSVWHETVTTGQGNWVNGSCGDEACEVVVVPSRGFSFQALGIFTWSGSKDVACHVL